MYINVHTYIYMNDVHSVRNHPPPPKKKNGPTLGNLLYFRFFYGLVISVADETPSEPFERKVPAGRGYVSSLEGILPSYM